LGEVFYDRDQCWELADWADREHMFFREWDPDYQQEHILAKWRKQLIQKEFLELRDRLANVLDQLRAGVGQHYSWLW